MHARETQSDAEVTCSSIKHINKRRLGGDKYQHAGAKVPALKHMRHPATMPPRPGNVVRRSAFALGHAHLWPICCRCPWRPFRCSVDRRTPAASTSKRCSSRGGSPPPAPSPALFGEPSVAGGALKHHAWWHQLIKGTRPPAKTALSV